MEAGQAMRPADRGETPLEARGGEPGGAVGEEEADGRRRGRQGGKPVSAAPRLEVAPVALVGAPARGGDGVARVLGGAPRDGVEPGPRAGGVGK
jgi:hypothetical protein